MKHDRNLICKGMSKAYKAALAVVLSMFMAVTAMAQTRTVTGTVTDASGEPLTGATVLIKGTQLATPTDIDGNFSIAAAPNQTLVVTYVGFLPQEVKASKTHLDIVLQENSELLDEVVVVGYGVARKETLTGAISSVTNKEITVTKNENIINMLSGKLPGVRIQQRSAQPGAFDNHIDIRGMGSPLIVVDGIPRDEAYFARMDPNEIDQVSVLKDASAAVYGVRAANGVILVTTKHGSKNGKVDVTFQANIGIQRFLNMPETADATTHMLLMNEKQYNSFDNNYPVRVTPRYTYDQMFPYSSGQKASTNWYDEMFRDNVPLQQYNISVDGGNDRISYFFNLGYQKQDGSYKTGSLNYSRWNFRSNVDARITDHLRAQVQVGGYIDETNEPQTGLWTVYKRAWTYRPTSEAWIDGNHSLPAYDEEMLESENPAAVIDSDLSGYRKNKRRVFNGQLALIYEIPWVKGLELKAMYNYDYNTTDNTDVAKQYNLYRKNADGTLETLVRPTSETQITRRTDPSHATLLNLGANYHGKFDVHEVGATLLFEEIHNEWTNFWATRNMLLNSDYLFAGEEEGQIGRSDSQGDMTRRALIGKLDYNFAGKYLLNFAFRYDGSSRYPKDGRWGFFPSVSAGWRISEEKFFNENISFVDNLKIRASWGRLGDDGGVGTYPSTVVGYNLDPNKAWLYNGKIVTGVNPTAIPNPYWTWYTAETWNFGLDWDLWNQKLTGTAEFFVRNRSGLPATSDRVLPNIVGASMPQENKEKDRTFGWEFSLGHHNRVGEMHYYVTGQISATRNRWIEVLRSEYTTSMGRWKDSGKQAGRNTNIWWVIPEGGRFTSLEQIRNHPYPVGSGTLPGDYWYEDWNGDGVVNGNDSYPMKVSGVPVFNYGFTAGAEWRGIDFAMAWQGAQGLYNTYGEVFSEVGPFDGSAALTMYRDRWHTASIEDDPWNPNTQWIEGFYPATGHSFTSNETGILNSSFLRLKSIELGYTFPTKWMSVCGVKSLRVYANAYNLLTFTGVKNMDPERPGGDAATYYRYPNNKTFNFGITARF